MDYTPHTEKNIREMLDKIGVKNIDDLFSNIPDQIKLKQQLDLPQPLPEPELVSHCKELSSINTTLNDKGARSLVGFIGAGTYQHFIPTVVSQLAGRGEFLTAYTPYQPEVSQGTLQAVFEFQTFICQLTGMDVANASMYDGASATAEAVLMAHRILKNRCGVVFALTLHPEYQEVIRTYLSHWESSNFQKIGWTSSGEIDLALLKKALEKEPAAVVIQSPNFFGIIEPLKEALELIHKSGAIAIVVNNNPTSLGLFEAPGNLGADIVVGEAQAFGNEIGFGGPHVGFFATKDEFVRTMPGRLVGETMDNRGQRAFTLTLSTREQHIRRERATSNICTNQGICALKASIYLSLLGKEGLKQLASLNYSKSEFLKSLLKKEGKISFPFSGTTYNEFVLKLHGNENETYKKLIKEGFIPGVTLSHWYPELPNHLLINVTEIHPKSELERFTEALRRVAT
ncbi:MAG: glycine dehydrogenase (aminomethyl-transferring) [Deltaproteobacteria bacterium RIFCSPHIGHO2_12_FULL_43_9]|nr:MAG: glycine dehydrogenase (aminomethyl-transferring) [Deltaproteobacteria bacterium RIFCSPHIGHO2_12_FULL_43_9]